MLHPDQNTSLDSFLDSSNGGTVDWFVSPEAKDNFIECTDYYCKITCTVYRLFINDDSVNDVQYPESNKNEAVSGFRYFLPESASSAAAASASPENQEEVSLFRQGRSAEIEIEYGGAFSGVVMAATATIVSLLSL